MVKILMVMNTKTLKKCGKKNLKLEMTLTLRTRNMMKKMMMNRSKIKLVAKKLGIRNKLSSGV